MSFNLEQAIEILERTPEILKIYLSGLSDDWIFANEGNDSWNTFDIMGHLIHGEHTDWITRMHLILEEGPSKTFEPFDRFAQFNNSKGKSITELIETFDVLRKKNVNYLRSLQLSNADFEKEGIHPDLGVVSLRELLATWVTHDLGHLAQICRVMAKRYTEDVGPWFDYISILKDRI